MFSVKFVRKLRFCHQSPFYKGEIKTAVKTFADGTKNVIKYKIELHLKSKSHEIALSVEQDRLTDKRIIIEKPDVTRKIQPTITSCINASAKDSHRKLLRTAYELALAPNMSLKHFEVLVKCQKQNGLKPIHGKQDERAVKEYIYHLLHLGGHTRESRCRSCWQ